MIKLIELSALKTEGLQTRDGLSLAVVKDYAEQMKAGKKLPPLSVVRNAAGELFLIDGFHRLAAMRRLKRQLADADVVEGEFLDALRAALRANVAHGLRRSNADKRNALTIAWQHRVELFGGDPSHEVLADACAVSKITARRFRENVTGVLNEHPCDRVGKDGKTYSSPSVMLATSTEAVRTDRFGMPIPERLVAAFDSPRFAAVIKAARQLKDELEAGLEESDYGFSKVSQSTTIALDNFISDLKQETPYCVCPQCQGIGCRACNDIGVQTRLEYERNPQELRVRA